MHSLSILQPDHTNIAISVNLRKKSGSFFQERMAKPYVPEKMTHFFVAI
jgi:hypothetical protein